MLGLPLFLKSINDLADGVSSNAKLFADNTSLVSVVHNRWVYRWEMSFNSDPIRQDQEVIFSLKAKQKTSSCGF